MRNIFLQITILVSVIVGLVACSKNDSAQPGPTHMRWVNVVPDMSFDIYSNREKIATNLIFDTSTAYAAGLPGFYSLQVTKTGESDTLVNGRQQLTSGTYYTTFLLPDTTGGSINTNKATVSIVTENTAIPARDTMKLRFFNFAAFSPTINVVMTIDGRTNAADTLRPFLNRIFNDQSYTSSYTTYRQFLAVNWKMHFYNATTDSLIDSFHYQFTSQSINTMYIKSISGKSATDTFAYKVIQRDF